MKKILLLSTLIAAAMTQNVNAETIQVFNSQDRDNWTITGCSMANSGGDGGFDKMLDGNTTTFWHADYNNDDPNSLENNPHFFVVDRGEGTDENTVDGFGFQSRTDAFTGNGYVRGYRVYVVDNITGITVCNNTGSFQTGPTAHADLVAFLEDKQYAAQGEFPESIKSADGALQQVAFEQQQKGRYVIFVIDSSWNNNLKNSALCAEFYLYDVTESEFDFAPLRTEAISKIRPFESFAGTTAYNAAVETINASTSTSEIESTVNNIIATADQQIVSIKNIRRAGTNGQTPYLTLEADGNINTKANVTEKGKWQFKRISGTNNFKLMNVATKQYINNQAKCNVAEGNAAQFYLCMNTSGKPGVAIRYVNANNGLNIDTGGNDLVNYGFNDAGSSWSFDYVSTPASELTAGWYTIRCNRGLYVNTPGSLIGVQSADLAGDVSVVAGRAANYGSYWRIESTGENGWKLKNLLTEEKELGTNAQMLSEGLTFYLRAASEWNNPALIKNGLAISTAATGTDNNTCIDMGNGGGLTINGWRPISEGNGRTSNYGAVYYFEPVSDAVVEQARQDYYAYAATAVTTPAVHNAAIDEAATLYAHMPALWGDVDLEELNSLKADNGVEINTIALANATLRGEINVTDEEKINALHQIKTDADAMLGDKYFALRAGNQTTHHMASPESGSNATQHQTGAETQASTINTVWQLVGNGDGTYKLRSHGAGSFLGQQGAKNNPIPLNETGTNFTLIHHESCANNVISFLMPNATEAAHSLVFNDFANHRLTVWSEVSSNNNGGQWTLELMETSGNDFKAELSEGCLIIYANGIIKTEGLNDSHAITINSSMARAAAATILPGEVDMTAAENQARITVPADLENGEYTMNIPMGFFTVNGKLSKPLSAAINVSDSGTTAIEDITDNATPAETIIHDLQGRRVSKPGKGLFIVNGKKVFFN